MIGLFVVLYLFATFFIAYLGNKKSANTQDFALAGRRMPLYITSFALFATWFGSETVLGSSGAFLEKGWFGIVKDPLGAIFCLTLIGLFYARPLYRKGYISLSDLIRDKYGKKSELIFSVLMVISYLSWVAGQFMALALIFNEIFNIQIEAGLIISLLIVMVFTVIGGMWAISIGDFFQSIIIIFGLILIAIIVSIEVGGINVVISDVARQFSKNADSYFSIWHLLAALFTVGLGSIPSQDVFQRLSSAKDERTAVMSSFVGAFLYLLIAIFPLIVVASAHRLGLSHNGFSSEQTILSVVSSINIDWVKIVFFGALLSAILSTASAALLAPAVVLGENILFSFAKKKTDDILLFLIRISVVILGILSVLLCFLKTSIYELVALSSSFTLVSLFATMTLALFWKKASSIGSITSMFFGLFSWGIAEMASASFPPILIGLFASIIVHLAVDLRFEIIGFFKKS